MSDYKFTESEILSLEGRDEIRFAQQLNASDYRAMRYAFDGDLMFDSDYYIKEYDLDPNKNPFTDYNEQATDIGLYRNPNAVFDESFYNGNNPNVANSGMTGLEDYMTGGWRAGLIGDPNYDPERNTDFNPFFSSEDYFTIHDDVRVESYDPEANSPLQDLMDFGFVEGRITSEIGLSDDVLAFSTLFNSDSEGFEVIQDKVNGSNLGIEISPGENGSVLIASAADEGGVKINPIVVGGVVYTIFGLAGYTLLKTGELALEVAEDAGVFENITLSPADPFEIDQVLPPFVRDIFTFPKATEGKIVVESFPGGEAITFNEDNIFTTPLEPVTNLDSPTVFPGRDEILADLLEGPFVFPNANQIPRQLFNASSGSPSPYPVGSSSSQGIQEVEDFISGLRTDPTPTNSKRNFFEIEQTGPRNYIIETGRLTPKGRAETSALDGFRGRTILEAKFTQNFGSSPFIPGTMTDKKIEGFIVGGLENEFEKFSILVNDPSVPFNEVEVLINDARIAPFFEDLLDKFDLPGQVKVVPTQVPF